MVLQAAAPFKLRFMAKKTYRTFYLNGLNLLLTDEDGKRIEVRFRKGIQVDSTAKYVTSDEKVQALMEKSSGFGRDYYVESVVENNPVAEEEIQAPVVEEKKEETPTLTDVKDVKRFHNIVEMRAAMAELGFEGVQGMGYLQLKSAASKEGYDFQIQKN